MKVVWEDPLRGDEVFKVLHKTLLPSRCYALDADLLLVEKDPPIIVAHLEFKVLDEPISFAQAIAFNHMIRMPLPWRIPVYIVRSEQACAERYLSKTKLETDRDVLERVLSAHSFSIYEYAGADWRPEPPLVREVLVAEGVGWDEFKEWEMMLRVRRRHEIKEWFNTLCRRQQHGS